MARQLARAGLPPRSLTAVCVTHHHSDHNIDVGAVVHLAWCADLSTPVAVIGPPPLRRMMDAYVEVARVDVETRVVDEGRPPFEDLLDVREIASAGTVFEDDRVRITCARVDHPPMDAYAYRIDADDRSYVISGDTAPCDSLVALARGADILVHEVLDVPSIATLEQHTNGHRLREHLIASHTSATDVAAIASAAGVRTLVLSHLVPSQPDLPDGYWLEQVRSGATFAGDVVVGRDLMEL
ncbi:MBL fold metallo-hydrolase [Luteipulveratus mongoliensis]|uniref:MBL fold metallo-hydrolase n=1 Tax=Luteipulveratus mongoliensis TaxID=571913 RepID=UPI0006972F4D|nr:MBL fold metallo-hydrolase [Luteipulveratus mongoliensis]